MVTKMKIYNPLTNKKEEFKSIEHYVDIAARTTKIIFPKATMTLLKKDLEELVETEKKRDVVGEELEKYHILENNIELTDNSKEIEVDLEVEKEVGDE